MVLQLYNVKISILSAHITFVIHLSFCLIYLFIQLYLFRTIFYFIFIFFCMLSSLLEVSYI